MAKIGFWQILGLIGTLSQEVSEALEDDAKIDAMEIVEIGRALIDKLNFPIDEDSQAKLDLVIAVVDEVVMIMDDKKITVKELLDLGEKICEKLGVELDKEGFSW